MAGPNSQQRGKEQRGDQERTSHNRSVSCNSLNLDLVTYAPLHAMLESAHIRTYVRAHVHVHVPPRVPSLPHLAHPLSSSSRFYILLACFFFFFKFSVLAWLTGACCINSHPGRNTLNSRRASEDSKGLQGSASCVLYRSILCLSISHLHIITP